MRINTAVSALKYTQENMTTKKELKLQRHYRFLIHHVS